MSESTLRRRRPESCLSDLQLDRLRLGELATATTARNAAEEHLKGCLSCSARASELAAVPVPDILDAAPRVAVATKPTSRRSWAWPTAAGGFTAASLALLLLLKPASTPHEAQAVAERSKGSANAFRLNVVVKHADGTVEPVLPDDKLTRNDQLRFRVSGAKRPFVAIISFDSAGRVTPFLPAAGMTTRVEPGKTQWLDGAVALDETIGRERIHYLNCATAIPVTAIVQAGEAALRRAGGNIQSIESLGLECDEGSFWIQKAVTP